MIFWVMNRWGQQTGCIGDVIEAIHKDELNGEDSLTLVLPSRTLAKGDRVVWRDRFDEWHEHIVNEVAAAHTDGLEYYSVYCENSIAETMTDYLAEVVCEDVAASVALNQVLAPTRWSAGTVDNLGENTLYYFEASAHGAIGRLLETWGGEYKTEIAVSGEGVSQRRLHVKSRRGEDGGKLFTYGHDMSAVEQTVSADDVVTRLHCFGKGTGNGDADAGYTERLTFAEVNGGRDYVEDDAAKLVWGLPDGNGGVKHAEGVAIFDDCDDEEELLELGRAELEERSHPHVSYKASVAILSDYGYDYDDARTGDTVAMRDKTLDLRLQGRITCVTRYLVNTGATVVEMGDTARSITDVMGDQRADLDWLRRRSGGWDAAAWSNASWLDRFIGNLNEQMNATGGYVYWEQGIGITVYDRPVDQNPTMAIQLNGMGFRIANSKNSNNEWNWRTFGTGDGFVADEIVSGMLRCGTNYIDLTNGVIHLENGLIQDADGTNYWNLMTGAFRTLRGTIGGMTVDGTAMVVNTGTVTFDNNSFVVNSDHFDVDASGNIAATSGTIGGFTIGNTALYNGMPSISSQNQGVYVGTDGIATSDGGSNSMRMYGGTIRGYQGTRHIGTISPTLNIVSAADPSQVVARGILIQSQAVALSVDKLYVKDNDGSGNLVDGVSRSFDKYFLMPSSWTAWRDFDPDGSSPVTLKMAEWEQQDVNGVMTYSDIDDANYDSYSFYCAKQVDAKLSGKANTDHTHSGYALTNHTHSQYAAVNHSHSEYAPASHTHTYGSITGAPSVPTFSLSDNVLTITL